MVTLAIWGEVTPGAILTKCGLWGDMVDVITYAIFRDCRLRGVGVVHSFNCTPAFADMRLTDELVCFLLFFIYILLEKSSTCSLS